MSIRHMKPEQYASFSTAQNCKRIETFLNPKAVHVLQTDDGTVTVIETSSQGVVVVGDSVGVYRGSDTPDYLS